MIDTDAERALLQQATILEQQAEILRLRHQVRLLEVAYQGMFVAYTRRTQEALAAGLVRFVMTGDRP